MTPGADRGAAEVGERQHDDRETAPRDDLVTGEEEPRRPAHARMAPRPGYQEKKRNRRRKSKYARPLISVAHAMAALNVLLAVGFILALGRGAMQGADLALESVDSQRLAGLNLRGVAPQMRPRPLGGLQFMIWAYLFATPIVFGVQRGIFWRRTAHAARYVSFSLLAIWAGVILIVLLTATGG